MNAPWAVGFDLTNGLYFGCDARGITIADRTSTGSARNVATNVCAPTGTSAPANLEWAALLVELSGEFTRRVSSPGPSPRKVACLHFVDTRTRFGRIVSGMRRERVRESAK